MRMRPYILVYFDTGWFGVRVGAAYYNINTDIFHPFFVEFALMGKWRMAFEFGKVSRDWR